MIITNAKYSEDDEGNKSCVIALIGGVEHAIPLDPANRHYQAILEWAKIDGNTIEDAD